MPFLMCFCVFLLVLSTSCAGGSEPPPTPVRLPGSVLPDAPEAAPRGPALSVPLTQEASELRRIREEHSSLIASIPPTPVPTLTLTPAERSEVSVARVLRYPDGVPLPPRVGEDWFDPGVGLEFHREVGDDWTARSVRESHPHRNLFYFSGYPGTLPHFSDRSIYRHLSRELVFEAVSILPLLGDPTPAMVEAFSRNLGWELRDSPEPVVNLWTTFSVQRGRARQAYAVGGVMRMGVSSAGEGDDLMEYVTPGEWLGPVVVERLR